MPHRIPFSRQTDFTDYVQKHSEARRADSSPFQGDKRRWAPSGAAASGGGVGPKGHGSPLLEGGDLGVG